jgi:methylmalonyl-CoA mutase cobalamin-binding subunit
VRSLRRAAQERGLHDIRILVGGAVLKQGSPASLDVDFVAADVFAGVRYLDSLEEGKL